MRDSTIAYLALKIAGDNRTCSFAERANWIAAEMRTAQRDEQPVAPVVIDSKPTEFDRRHMAATIASGFISNGNLLVREPNASTTTNIARNALAIADAILRESKES